MQRYTAPALVTLAVFATFWAYAIASTLIRDLGKDVTCVDLGALFILGLIAGLALAASCGSRALLTGAYQARKIAPTSVALHTDVWRIATL